MAEYTERQKEFMARVEANLDGLEAVSTGVCPGCDQCMSDFGFEDEAEFEEAWSSGDVFDEESFSWTGCGICGSPLGGDRARWHWIDEDGVIMHEHDACTDCVMYLANGDVPDDD